MLQVPFLLWLYCTGFCEDLVPPANGSVEITGLSVGSVATYSCMEGLELNSTAVRTCLDDGSWSGTEPACSMLQTNWF